MSDETCRLKYASSSLIVKRIMDIYAGTVRDVERNLRSLATDQIRIPRDSELLKSLNEQVNIIKGFLNNSDRLVSLAEQFDTTVKKDITVERKRLLKEYGRPVGKAMVVEFDTRQSIEQISRMIESMDRIFIKPLESIPARFLDRSEKQILGCLDGLIPIFISFHTRDYVRNGKDMTDAHIDIIIPTRNIMYGESLSKAHFESFIAQLTDIMSSPTSTVSMNYSLQYSFNEPDRMVDMLNLLYKAFPCSESIDWRPTVLYPEDFMA